MAVARPGFRTRWSAAAGRGGARGGPDCVQYGDGTWSTARCAGRRSRHRRRCEDGRLPITRLAPAMPRRPDMPPLHRSALAGDPIEQFRDWYERAEREVPLAHAMTLATVDADGAPDARMVLLKGFGPDGVSLLHQPRVGQGEAARGARRGGARPLLARARPPGAGPRPGGAAARGGLRRVLRDPPARLPDRRLGLAPERAAARPRGAGRPGARDRGAVRRRRRPAPALLGRLRAAPRARSSSGRARPAASTTASSTRATGTAGGSSGWRRSGVDVDRVMHDIRCIGHPGRLRGRRGRRRERRQPPGPRSRAKASSSSRSSKWSSARMPRRAGRTRTPVPSADSSASSARASAASWSGWGTTFGRRRRRPSFARRSVSRTDQPRAAASRASARRASLPRAWRIARPWPSLSSPCGEQVEHLVGQVEEADQVRDRRAAAAQPPRQLLLAETQILDQRRAGARLVDRVEVLARHVLDQRGLQALRPRPRRGRSPAPSAGRPPAPPASGARRRSARSGRRAAGARSAAGRRPRRRSTRPAS